MKPSGFAVTLYVFGGVSGLIAVALSALTSHGLAGLAPTAEQAVEWFKIGTAFQMNHTLGLIAVTAIADLLAPGRPRTIMRASAVLLAAGALLFPAALYSLSFLGPSFFAPWGGIAAMAGWAGFAVSAVMAFVKTDAA
jgi:uncharacterized membrane protein YgdD (TMEM256/DUF423 family)